MQTRLSFHTPILATGRRGVLIVAVLLICTGCGMFSNKKAIKAVMPEFDRGRLTNTALLIPYINASQRAGGLDLRSFHQKIITVLKNDCKGLRLLAPEDPEAAKLMARLAAYLNNGDIVGFSESARAEGISAIVTGRIADVAADKRSWGLWWLADTNYYLAMQVDTTIYDVETGAKTIDDALTKEIKIDGLEYDAITMGQPADLTHIDALLDELATDSAERACKVLRNQPWIGYVTAVDGNRVTLVPGSEAGVAAGMKLHIFNSGTLLDGAMGYRYFVPGLETAAIEVVSVVPGKAVARILNGSLVAAGDSVRLLD